MGGSGSLRGHLLESGNETACVMGVLVKDTAVRGQSGT